MVTSPVPPMMLPACASPLPARVFAASTDPWCCLCSYSSLLWDPPNLTCPFRQNPIQCKCHHSNACLKAPAGSPRLPLFCCSHKYFPLTFAALPECFIVSVFVKMFIFFPSSCISQPWEGKGQYFFGKFDNLSENAQHTEGIEQLSYRVYE